jgi:hypothetical protein
MFLRERIIREIDGFCISRVDVVLNLSLGCQLLRQFFTEKASILLHDGLVPGVDDVRKFAEVFLLAFFVPQKVQLYRLWPFPEGFLGFFAAYGIES